MNKKDSKFEKDWFKNQFIRIAKDHRKHCDGEDCGIALNSLWMMLEKSGIKLNKKEMREFL